MYTVQAPRETLLRAPEASKRRLPPPLRPYLRLLLRLRLLHSTLHSFSVLDGCSSPCLPGARLPAAHVPGRNRRAGRATAECTSGLVAS